MRFGATMQAVQYDENGAAHGWRVLFIHDHDLFRTALAESLRDDGHLVLEYAAPLHLPTLTSLPPVDAVITDCEPLSPAGMDFLRTFHALHPDTPIVLVTAWPPQELSVPGVAPDALQLLVKPVRYEDVCAVLRAAVGVPSPFAKSI